MKRRSIILAVFVITVALTSMAMEEVQSTPVPAPLQGTAYQDPLAQMIDQARMDGDVDLALRLAAQIPAPEPTGEELMTPTVRRVSTSLGAAGDPQVTMPPTKDFGGDIKVSSQVSDDREINPSLASDSNGNLYAAWQDDYAGLARDYVEVYKSTDGGTSWSLFGSITNTATLETPSIAIGEGSTGDLVLVAYIVDDGVAPRYIEVATSPLTGGGFTTHVVTQVAWDYFRPVIWTDSHQWSGWFAYITAEGMFDNQPTNRNVVFLRSTDGITWDTNQTLWGNNDAFEWIDPDGTYGTNANDIFVVCFNNSDNTLYMRRSVTGISFDPEITIATSAAPVSTRVDPEIEAAVDLDNLFLGFTWRFGDSTTDDAAYTYSSDFGATWLGPFSNLRDATYHQAGVAMTANKDGGSFHLALIANGTVYYSKRPQTLGNWDVVNEPISDAEGEPSISYPKKGIASNWTTDDVGIAWADFREGLPVYEIFFNASDLALFADGFESGDADRWSLITP
jgi:hypothetical protein